MAIATEKKKEIGGRKGDKNMNVKMTKKEALALIAELECFHGYKSYKGYACQYKFKKHGILITLGYNSGIYGWNWSLILDLEYKRVFIDCYKF